MDKDQSREEERRRRNAEEALGAVLQTGKKALDKVLPFGAQIVASATAYSVGITASQLLGFVLKVSCATPVLGPTMGLLGVGLANVLAGQASKHTRKMVVTKSHPLQPGFWETPNLEDVMLDAVMGACVFKALGGRFSSVMPSDLTKPGALAFESIPTRADNSEAYAAPGVKRELARIFKRDGCHHCGSRRPPVIGDHMPPNKLMQGSRDQLAKGMEQVPLLGKVFQIMNGGRRRGPMQRFYPQCQRCSIRQATAVRSGKRVLVLHLQLRGRSEHLSGVFVGLRYNAPEMSSSGGDCRRRSGKFASLTLASAPAVDVVRMVDGMSPAAEISCISLQQLPPVLGPEHSSSSSSLHKGWGGGLQTGLPQSSLPVVPLIDGSTAYGNNWQQQQHEQQQQPGVMYTSSRGSSPHGYLQTQGMYTAYGGAAGSENGKYSGGKAGSMPSHSPTSMALMQHTQQRLRGVSGPGDEMARTLDQNPAGPHPAEAQGAALMVSLEGWAASPPGRRSTNPAADVAMAPEHAKARATAAFERHFAPGPGY